MRHFAKYDLVPLLSLLSVAAFPCVFLYARNCDEVPPGSMVPFLIVFTVTGLLMLGVFSVIFRNVSRGAFLADLSLLVVINFCLIAVNLKRLLPFFRDRYLMAILVVAFLWLFFLLLRKKPDLRSGCLLILIAFSSMMAINMILAIPTLLRTAEYQGLPQTGETVTFGENRPNVYYYIFDEYGGYENLLYYYNYDNWEFLEALEERGFSVARESRNTEAVETVTIVPNLLNLRYTTNLKTPYQQKLAGVDNTYLSQIFRDNGYDLQLVNHVDYLGKTGMRVLTKNQTRRTISEILMRNSLFQKSKRLKQLLDDFFVMDYGANYRASLDNAMEEGLNAWQTAQDGPTFTLGYIQCPHSPTMVGPKGEELEFSQGWNWRRPELYLGQVQYISGYILKLVDTIQEHDPGAVIILQSDHGNRYAIHMVQLAEWDSYDPYLHNPYMQNILNCVYYQGQAFDIEGETGINTLRLVLRQVLGADLEPIEPKYDYSSNYQDEMS